MIKMAEGTTSESVGAPPICVPIVKVALPVELDMIRLYKCKETMDKLRSTQTLGI